MRPAPRQIGVRTVAMQGIERTVRVFPTPPRRSSQKMKTKGKGTPGMLLMGSKPLKCGRGSK